MIPNFSNITILGGGLLGGSLALALSSLEEPPKVRLWARSAATVKEAKALGIVGAVANLKEAVADADLLVLAVPVGSMPGLLENALEAELPRGCVVTDVGSVKQVPHQALGPILVGREIVFVGSHPMAGSEKTGITAISATLFQDAACILTNDEHVSQEVTAKLERFWQRVGCRTAWMNAQRHDQLVARISHLPHVLASSAARICLKKPDDGNFGGGGLRDTTRIAAGNPEMWDEILTENRMALLEPIREAIVDLSEILVLLKSNDREGVRQWLATAKDRRDQLNF